MKPDTRNCLQCGKEISRGKFCTPKHKMAFRRNSQTVTESVTNPESVTQKSVTNENVTHPEHEPGFRDKLTKTDKTYYDRAMKELGEPYYRFLEAPERDQTCIRTTCSVKFKTTLTLCHYCSYDHYKQTISGR